MSISQDNVARTWEVDSRHRMVFTMRVRIGDEVIAAQITKDNREQSGMAYNYVEDCLKRQIMGTINSALFRP